MTEGTVPVPHTAPALSDDDIVPVRGVSYRGATAAGVKPRRAFGLLLSISYENIISSFDKGIVILLSISYDERRRPRRDTPAADREIQKTSYPLCLGEALRRESFI